MSASSAKIEVRDLCKAFGREPVLTGVDLEIGAGEAWVLLGASGSGKTVLLKCIIGLVRPDAGSVAIDGDATNSARTRRVSNGQLEKIGMLFQRSALFDSLKVWENIAFRLLQTKQVSREEARDIAIRRLALVHMGTDVADLMPAELSGGMQKRVALARAIAGEPEILLLDEPTAGLDPILSNGISDLIAEIVRDLNTTVISITNDIDSAHVISDRVAMLHNGAICWTGPTERLTESGDAHVEEYIRGWVEEQARLAAHAKPAPQGDGAAPNSPA